MVDQQTSQSLPPGIVTFRCIDGESIRVTADCFEPSLQAGLTVAVCTYRRAASLIRFLDSLLIQDRKPEELIIVDASPDRRTEDSVLKHYCMRQSVFRTVYCRVAGNLRGLTRQRNLALKLCTRELLAFFDDDIILDASCLGVLEQTFLDEPKAVGVGAYIQNEDRTPGYRWQLLRWAGAVPDLIPGKYSRSGLSIPLRLLHPTQDLVEVDRLQGCCMVWRSALARRLTFNERFNGYCQGEDLEFSCRASRFGKLLVSARASVIHLKESDGRPDLVQMGRMALFNRYYIHRTTLENRTWLDVLWFAYAQFISDMLHVLSLFGRGQALNGCSYALGLLLGIFDVLTFRSTTRDTLHPQHSGGVL